jgi:hypothetical protein
VGQIYSHTGSVLEGSVDALAKGMDDTLVAVPVVASRHVSLRFYAKRSERELALTASTLHLLRRYNAGATVVRASTEDVDVMRAVRLCERDQLLLRLMRADRARLQASRAYPDTGPTSVGAYLRDSGCPCGGGAQTQAHLLWWCTLPGVVAERRNAASSLKTVTGEHLICRACCDAFKEQRAPRGQSGLQGINYVSTTDTRAAADCLRHLLGVVRQPTGDSQLNAALRAMRPVLLAVLAMQRAAESASARVTAAVVQRALRHAKLRDALSQIQLRSWLAPAKRAVVPVAGGPPRRQLRSRRVPPGCSGCRYTGGSGAGSLCAARRWRRVRATAGSLGCSARACAVR